MTTSPSGAHTMTGPGLPCDYVAVLARRDLMELADRLTVAGWAVATIDTVRTLDDAGKPTYGTIQVIDRRARAWTLTARSEGGGGWVWLYSVEPLPASDLRPLPLSTGSMTACSSRTFPSRIVDALAHHVPVLVAADAGVLASAGR